ncbi:UbiX family flavin prenyltransferase [Terasakiella pusilla]|jgi:4-hydroxy-3-polyprenylbenzoate decarboxylase|uniref:UbiX family flavin prenyltransferase n=2 Tax=Terasakiella pusilla TaxID=64973 RepID=UPI000A82F88F|nr:UbiX family flavin prenyltransferase [Terasakiella pusilla]
MIKESEQMTLPLIVGISGASGVIYGVELLRALKAIGHPTHLVISDNAQINLELETDVSLEEVKSLADVVYDTKNMGAAISSGSFKTKGMIIAPCAIKTLSGIAISNNSNLLIRSADVCLKEHRRLVLMVRETPLHKGHLELMAKCADLGATILPPVPAFYHKPQTVQDIIHQSIGKALDQFDIEHNLFERWKGV